MCQATKSESPTQAEQAAKISGYRAACHQVIDFTYWHQSIYIYYHATTSATMTATSSLPVVPVVSRSILNCTGCDYSGVDLHELGDTGGRYYWFWHLPRNISISPVAAPMPPGLSWSSPTSLCTPEIAAPSPPGGRWLQYRWMHARGQPVGKYSRQVRPE